MSRWGVTAPPRVALLFKSRRVIPSKPLSCTSPSLHQSIHPSIHQSINNQSIEQNRIHRNQTNQEKKFSKSEVGYKLTILFFFFLSSQMAPLIRISISQSIRQLGVQSREVHDLALGFVRKALILILIHTSIPNLVIFSFQPRGTSVFHVSPTHSPNATFFFFHFISSLK